MGFEIGKNVQSSDVTLKQLQEQFKKEKDKENIFNIFEKFNTNKTVNAEGEQVLDQTEQAAMMAFFKQVAGGKKDSSIDTEVSRSDVRNFKKNNKGDKFAKNLSYKDMKKMMSAFNTTINEDSTDNKEISYNTNNSGVRIIKVDGKDYRIDENNQVTDADGVKYEYDENGQLKQIQNGNTTTSFEKGVKKQDVKTEDGVTTTTTYNNDKGNYKASETVTSHGGKLEIVTKYIPNSENVFETKTTDKRTEGQTVTTIDSGRTRKVKTEKPDYEKQENFDLAPDGTPTRTTSTEKGNGVTTITDYKKKTRTIADTKNNTDTEITFSSFDEKSGDITVAKTVVTDKTNHSRITTNAGSKTKIIETLDNNNKTVKRTATIDTEKHTATIEVNGKKITLNTDSQGNILANAKFTGSRMETVGEVAIRLGYAKDSEEYNAIVKANGGADARIAPGKGIKISQSAKNINKINLETAEVDSKAQVKAYKEHQAKVAAERQAKAKLATINNRIKNSNTRAAVLAKNIPGAKGGVRQTYATAKHKVYCDNLYNISNQGYQKNKAQGDWQQHYVYNPITDKMVTLESVMDNNKQLKGAKVMYITENGYATLTDGRTIHISFDNFDNQMSTYVETLKTNYEASVEDLKKDAALSRANMEKMKTVDGQDIERTDAEEVENKPQMHTTVSEWNSNYTSGYETVGIKYNDKNYISLEGGTATSLDADAILHMNGARYTIKRSDGVIFDTTMDYYNITGTRGSITQKNDQHIINSEGYFDVNSQAFDYNRDKIYLDAHGDNVNGARFDGCQISKIQDTTGKWRVVIEKDGVYYDMNKLLHGKEVTVRPGTFFNQG